MEMDGKKVVGWKTKRKRKNTETESEEFVDQSAQKSQKRLVSSSADVPKSQVIDKQKGSNATSKKPPSAFILYYNDQCKMDLDNEGKKKKWTRSAKIELGKIWKKLPKKEKDKYTTRNAALNEEYKKAKMVKGNDTGSMKRKETFDTRCSPSRFREMLDTLGAAYDASIRDIGFGGLLSLRRHKLKRPLCRWLVDIFDCDSRSFTLGGHKVSVSLDDVTRVLGLTSNGVRISFHGDDKHAIKLCERFNLPIEAPIKLLNLEDQLKKAKPESDEFKAKFLLYTLGRLLCPGSDVTTHRKYVLCLNEDALRGRVNWAQHVYDALIDGIQSYQQAMDRTYVSGCILVLQVLFLDHVARSGQRDVSGFSVLPRISAWGEVEIRKIMRRNRGFEKLNDRKGRGMAQPLRSTIVEEHTGGVQFTSLLRDVDHRLQKVEQEVKGLKGRRVAEGEVAKQSRLQEEVVSMRTEVRALQEDVRAMLSHSGQTKGRLQPSSDTGTKHLSPCSSRPGVVQPTTGECVATRTVPPTTTNIKSSSCIFLRDMEDFLPTLCLPDYYMKPCLKELAAQELMDPGYCSRVPDFTVGRFGYGCVKFFGKTDVRWLDIDQIVKIHRHEVVVYEDESAKPVVGLGLNKAAEVTLILEMKLTDLEEGKLRESTERQGASFVSFNPENGEWKFSVEHFSRFGLSEDDEEDDVMDDATPVQDPVENNGGGEASNINEMDPTGPDLSHSLIGTRNTCMFTLLYI